MFKVQANILIVGAPQRSQALKELPVRIFTAASAKEAVRYLREERIDSIISQWNLNDMPNGKFLANIKAAKPGISTTAFITPGDQNQEIAARSLGISVVLNEDVNNECLSETICQLLAISPIAIQEVTNKKSTTVNVA
jgi:DNA-binding NarL/FixJ family response regulator